MSDTTLRIIMWTLLAWGVLLLIWNRWRIIRNVVKRFKRRCPKCWYDMSHTAGLTCSECGKTAKRERRLFRVRRRWLIRAVAVMALIGSYTVNRAIIVKNESWEAAVPTTAMIIALPWINDRADESWKSIYHPPANPPPIQVTTSMRLMREFATRCKNDELTRWQWRLLLRRIFMGGSERSNLRSLDPDQERFAWGVLLRAAESAGVLTDADRAKADQGSRLIMDVAERWPSDAMVYGSFRLEHWEYSGLHMTVRDRHSNRVLYEDTSVDVRRIDEMYESAWYPWRDGYCELVPTSAIKDGIPITIELQRVKSAWADARHIRTYDTIIPIEVAGSMDDYISVRADAAVAAALKAGDRPSVRVSMQSDEFVLNFHPKAAETALRAASIPMIALHLEMLEHDRVIAEGYAWWRRSANWRFHSPTFSSLKERVMLRPVVDDWSHGPSSSYSLRLTADPNTALRHRDHTIIWDGEVTLPLDVEFR
ncbi:MAG: hypothetical protein AAF432_06645 [Planctomycetota bacterium]